MPVVRFTGTRMTPDEEMVLRLRHGRYLPAPDDRGDHVAPDGGQRFPAHRSPPGRFCRCRALSRASGSSRRGI